MCQMLQYKYEFEGIWPTIHHSKISMGLGFGFKTHVDSVCSDQKSRCATSAPPLADADVAGGDSN